MSSQKAISQAIEAAGVFQSGHFIFANGGHAQVKLEMDNLWDHPQQLSTILQALAEAQGLPTCDVILGVPTGGQRLAQELVQRGLITAKLARLERVPGGAKQDFRFCSNQDRDLALSATSIRVYEDVVTTLSSIAGVVRLLQPQQQTISSLAIWRRGKVKSQFQAGVTDHYLIERELPQYFAEACPICNA